jgi:hypothetical protein
VAKAGEPALKIDEAAFRPPEAAAAAAGQGGVPAQHLFDVLLGAARPHFNAHFIEETARVFRACGSYGLLAAMVVIAAFALIMAGKTGQLGNLLWGAMLILILAAAQYVAGKLCGALDEQSRTAGERLSSDVFPNCVALLSVAAGVATLLLSVAIAIGYSYYTIIPVGVAAFLVWSFLAAVALNPATLGISIGPGGRASQEAIGVLTFLLKAFVRLAPVAFGAGVICGVLLLGYACGAALAGDKGLLHAADTAGVARASLWWSALLPPAGYVLFLLGCLVLDLCRAILGLPAGAEKWAEQNPGQEREKIA